MNTSLSSNSQREYFIDWLRMLAILGVLLFHVGMFFGSWGWHIKNNDILPWLDFPMDIAHRLRMPLLFVIAGAAVSFSLRRRNALQFIGERARRLLVPVLFGMLVIVPPQIFVERVAHGEYTGHYLSFFFDEVLQFVPYPEGSFSWHHLWFIVYLFVYMLLFAPLFVWWKKSGKQLKPGWWLLFFALPLGLNEAVLRPYFPERHSLLDDWWVFNNYALLLWFGFVLSRTQHMWQWLAQRRRALCYVLLGVSVAVIILKALGIVVGGNTADAFTANIFVWVAILTMLAYGKQYLNKDSRVLPWIREFAYPLYILHQTVIILLAWPLMTLTWSVAAKASIIFFGTVFISVTIFLIFIRPFGVMRLLFGLPYQQSRLKEGQGNESVAPLVVVTERLGQ